jgi:Fur family ferric uptake transcriptional regulator
MAGQHLGVGEEGGEIGVDPDGGIVEDEGAVAGDVLAAADEHLSASAVIAGVHTIDQSINDSSVYRALTLFSDVGLVRESRLDEVATWEPFHDDAAIHLKCSNCGVVIHHDTELVHELRRALERDSDFRPDEIDVRVAGRCGGCTAE